MNGHVIYLHGPNFFETYRNLKKLYAMKVIQTLLPTSCIKLSIFFLKKKSESSAFSQIEQEHVDNLCINECRRCCVLVKLSVSPRGRRSFSRDLGYQGPQKISRGYQGPQKISSIFFFLVILNFIQLLKFIVIQHESRKITNL